MKYALHQTHELIDELKKYCQAYVILYHKHDENLGINNIKTQIQCYEQFRCQALGLSSRLLWWINNTTNIKILQLQLAQNSMPEIDEFNKEAKKIVNELKKRCMACIVGLIYNDNLEVNFHQWDNAPGQSLGMANELNIWIQANFK